MNPLGPVSENRVWSVEPVKSTFSVCAESRWKEYLSTDVAVSRFPAPTAGTPSDTDTDDDNDPNANDCGAGTTFIVSEYAPTYCGLTTIR